MVSAPSLKRIGILTGPTATGKTGLAITIARQARERGVAIEIVNADSLLVYRGLDIGTAKPTREELAQVPHHLIDIRDPAQAYNAGDFVRDVEKTIEEIEARNARPLIVGGTGFYLKALMRGLWEEASTDPERKAEIRRELDACETPALFQELLKKDPQAAQKIGTNDRYRLIRALEVIALSGQLPSQLEAQAAARPWDPRFELWITDRPQAELQRRIELRTQQMLEAGFIEEVQRIAAQAPQAPGLASVGYAQVMDYLAGKTPQGRTPSPGLIGLREEIALATRQLVKRQRTWFRGQTPGRWWLLSETSLFGSQNGSTQDDPAEALVRYALEFYDSQKN